MLETMDSLIVAMKDAVGMVDFRPVRVMGPCGNVFEVSGVYLEDETGTLILEIE